MALAHSRGGKGGKGMGIGNDISKGVGGAGRRHPPHMPAPSPKAPAYASPEDAAAAARYTSAMAAAARADDQAAKGDDDDDDFQR